MPAALAALNEVDDDLSDAEGGHLPRLSEVVEKVGFGFAHFRATVLGGGVWLADGAELLLICTVTRAVSKEMDLRAWERGIIVSVVFVGIFIGNFLCGPLGDTLGRRMPVILSYAGVCIFSLLTSLTHNIESLIIARLFAGIFFGIGQPAYTTLSTEITPVYWRMCMCGLAQVMFTIGEIYSCILIFYDDPTMKNLHWRWLIAMGAIPSFILCIVSYIFLRQSPSYLSMIGEPDEAKKILEAIAKDNGVAGQDFAFKPAPPVEKSGAGQALSRQLGTVFGKHMVFSTLTMAFACFELNLIFYGGGYALPQVVQDVDMGKPAAVALLEGVMWEFPGIALGVFFGMELDRKPVIMFVLCLITLSLLAFTHGATSKGDEWYLYYCLHGGFIGIKMFALVLCIPLYQYASEIYPTVARTTGTAVCLAFGRVGGMTAPMLYEISQEHTGSFAAFFHTIALFAVINFVLFSMMPEVDVKNLQERLISPAIP